MVNSGLHWENVVETVVNSGSQHKVLDFSTPGPFGVVKQVVDAVSGRSSQERLTTYDVAKLRWWTMAGHLWLH